MALGGALGSGLGAPWSRVTPRHCAWQAWHLVTSTFVSRGRRGTISHPQAFCVAGVAQSHIHHRFAWQAWHNLTSTIVLCGRRGTGWRAWVWFRRALVARDAAALCAAGVALGDIHFRFTWQARHNLTSTSVLRGRRGTISHPPSFCVAGVALMALGGALGSGLGALVARDAAALCVAGVAQSHIDLPTCFLHVYHPACVFFPFLSACLMFLHRHVLALRSLRHVLVSDMFAACLSSGMFFSVVSFRLSACLMFLHRHVLALRSLRHVLVSDMFAACLSSGMFFSVVSFRISACLMFLHRHVLALRSLRHVLVSDMFAACLSSGMFFSVVSFRISACLMFLHRHVLALRSLRHVLVSDMFAACLSSGMCFLSVSNGMFDVLACLHTFFCRLVSFPFTFAARYLSSSLWSLRQAGPCNMFTYLRRRYAVCSGMFAEDCVTTTRIALARIPNQ